MNMFKRVFIGLVFILLFITFIKLAHAQETFYVASTFELADPEIKPGDIISRNNEGKLVRSTVNYDTNLFGVVVDTAPVVFRTSGTGKPIARSGDVKTNVTTLGGPIAIGDSIASSTIAGKGQKAGNSSGYILGIALEAFDGKEITTGTINVMLAIGPGKLSKSGIVANFTDQIGSLFLKNIQTAENTQQIFRYIVAGIISIAAFFIGFSAFGKNITKGIEAIGRNPLAKQQIQAMIILNVVLIALVAIAGIILSLAIIRF